MKIIQLITELHPAGAEKVLLNLSRELKKGGHDVSVISLQPLPKKNTDIVDDLLEANIPVKSLNVTKFIPWNIFRLVKVLKREIVENSDHQPTTNNQQNPYVLQSTSNIQNPKAVLHSHLIHANLASRLASLFLNKNTFDYRIINTIHIAEKRKSKWWHFFLDKLTFRLCDVQTAVSEAAQQHHAEKIKVPPEKIPVIYNGIVPPKHLSEEEIKHLRQEWGFKKCSKVVGSVGRLNWQKGYDIFLKVLPKLSKKIPKGETWGIVILGEGSQRPYLKSIIDEINCNNIKIILPGYRKDAADCISAFDLFIMPSRYEGHPLTLLEAMSLGVPIIANDIPTITKVFAPYANGANIKFESAKPAHIVKRINDFIQREKIAPYLPSSIYEMTDEYLKLYN